MAAFAPVQSESANLINRAFCVVASVMALLIFSLPANAVLETDGANDTNYINLALPYAVSSCALDIQGGRGFESGVLLNSQWVLAAAHGVTDASGNITGYVIGVAQGTPISSDTNLLVPVAVQYVYPGFNDSGNGPDLLLLKLAKPVNAPTLQFGSSSANSVVTSVGYGVVGTPSSGLRNYDDGILRSWQATIDPIGGFGGVNYTYYQATDFGFNNRGLLNGEGAIYDSGGGVFNSADQLVGITTRSSGNWNDPVGFTIFDNLSQPEEYAWIMNTITPVQPVILSLSPAGADIQLVWQGKGGSNYVVQAAAVLGGTNAFTDVSPVINLPGIGAVTTNYLDLGALTNQNARFYRIRTD